MLACLVVLLVYVLNQTGLAEPLRTIILIILAVVILIAILNLLGVVNLGTLR